MNLNGGIKRGGDAFLSLFGEDPGRKEGGFLPASQSERGQKLQLPTDNDLSPFLRPRSLRRVGPMPLRDHDANDEAFVTGR